MILCDTNEGVEKSDSVDVVEDFLYMCVCVSKVDTLLLGAETGILIRSLAIHAAGSEEKRC